MILFNADAIFEIEQFKIGEMLTVDGVAVKHWTRTQMARARSSGEAEYYAMVTGCAEGLGM